MLNDYYLLNTVKYIMQVALRCRGREGNEYVVVYRSP